MVSSPIDVEIAGIDGLYEQPCALPPSIMTVGQAQVLTKQNP